MSKTETGYEECIVTYLDILGFRSMLESQTPREIAQTLEEFRWITKPSKLESKREPKEVGEESVVRVEIISDAIVRARTTKAMYQGGYLFWELLDLLHIQCSCINSGVIVRGALTIGELHLGDDLRGPVFGPALVKAYEMERDAVVYPRIVVETAVLDRLHNDPTMYDEGRTLDQELEHIDELLTEDHSGLWYIDYLSAVESECDDYNQYLRFLESHKTLVEKGLKSSKGDLKVRKKYDWLRSYHNELVGAKADSCYPYVRERLQSLLLAEDA